LGPVPDEGGCCAAIGCVGGRGGTPGCGILFDGGVGLGIGGRGAAAPGPAAGRSSFSICPLPRFTLY
jgi:hypothetical protein